MSGQTDSCTVGTGLVLACSCKARTVSIDDYVFSQPVVFFRSVFTKLQRAHGASEDSKSAKRHDKGECKCNFTPGQSLDKTGGRSLRTHFGAA